MKFEQACIDIDWYSGASKGQNEIFAMCTVEGAFSLITKLGRVEKTIPEAHEGAVNFRLSLDHLHSVESGWNCYRYFWRRRQHQDLVKRRTAEITTVARLKGSLRNCLESFKRQHPLLQ
jgi:hypothetical protein